MKRSRSAALAFAVVTTLAGISRAEPVAGKASLAQPAVSPDGKEVAFVSGGNIWAVPAEGGDAHILIAGAGDVGRPLYSPDGKQIAFASSRTGNGDIYLFTPETGGLRRVTFDDAPERPDAWSPDGKYLYYTTGGHDVGGCTDVYRVEAAGGTPMPVAAETYRSEFCAAPNRDGHTVAFCADGMAYSQWWRHGHSHIDEAELWITSGDPAHPDYRRLTDYGAKTLWPAWGADGRTLYYMSDRSGAENLWSVGLPPTSVNKATTQPAMPEPRQLTQFRDGRLLYPTVSADGRTIVFERDFGVWKYDVSTGATGPIPIHLRGMVAEPATNRETITKGVSELAVSHDGRKMAVVVRGQVYAAAANGGSTGAGSVVRVTHTDAVEARVAWANDDRRLVYTSTRDGPRHLYLYDFATKSETRLTNSAGDDGHPVFSPDDGAVVFARDGRELRAIDFSRRTGKVTGERVLARGLAFERPPFDGGDTPFAWAPRYGDWIACVSAGPKGFRNLYLVPAAGDAPPRQVSYLANAESNSVAWSPDGSLFFGSGQRTEESQLARVDLTPKTPKFRDDQFGDLFRERPNRTIITYPDRTTHTREPGGDQPTEQPDVHPSQPLPAPRPADETPSVKPATRPTVTPPTSRPSIAVDLPTSRPTVVRRPIALPGTGGHTEVNFDDIDQRLSLLPVGMDVDEVAVSPDGKALAFVGTGPGGGRPNIYLYPLDPPAANVVPRQLTATTGGKSYLQFVADPGGLKLYYLEDRVVHSLPVVPGAAVTDSPVSVDVDVDFDTDKMAVFEQAWRDLNENFHDPAFHGVDWAKTRERFAPQIAGARTPTEVRRLLSLMVGELNASHLGVSAPAEQFQASTGRLGVTFDAAEYARSGRLKIASILPFGPAALVKLDAGQFVVAVDGTPAGRPANLDELLDHKADKEVVLTVSAHPDDAKDRRDVRALTISGATERTIGYRAWVLANRAYVAKASRGRLGYVHLADMTEQEMARLSTDLDAKNEAYDGVVVDVRNNNGGFVNGYAIDIFARRNYLTLQPRGFPAIAGRVALGQRYLGLPTVLVTNRHTLSDGEDFTEGFQALGLGQTVGEPTAGWIIFTSGVSLLDGTQFRIPAQGVLDSHGQPMEMHPRPVQDLIVRQEGEATAGRDSQLDGAVADLLKQLDGRKR